MDINSISSVNSYDAGSQYEEKKVTEQAKETAASNSSEKGVVYEPTKDDSAKTDSAKQIYNNKTDYKKIAEQLKADADYRKQQMVNLVAQTLGKQADSQSIIDLFNGKAEPGKGLKSIYENMKVDQATIDQAKKDISEDGYWGVKQTSDRLVDMAIALSGNDTSKADLLMDAIKKGYEQAAGAWGDKLPDISKQTLDATMEKMEQWKNGTITDVSKDLLS